MVNEMDQETVLVTWEMPFYTENALFTAVDWKTGLGLLYQCGGNKRSLNLGELARI